MINDNDDDVPLLNDNDDNEQFITAEDSQPNVEAVFVVTFDVKYGNIIEFQMPEKEHMLLSGVEYKAIPSGSHHINQDFVYFRHENKYGLACLARADITNDDDGSALSVIDQSQRGMRIKSVGILTSSIIHIQSYLSLLQTEARIYLSQASANYDGLKRLLIRQEQPISVPASIYDSLFAQFIQQFGASIFPLSRLILLGKRVLFYSRSPIGPLCNAVYFTHIINQSVNPLFLITIADLSMLNNEQSYIGCTTERIFKEKTHIYDVFIDCDNQIVFHTNDSILQSIVKITRHDYNRLKKTLTLNSFINIGNHLSRLLNQLSQSNDNKQMTKENFHSIDLHQHYDRLFLNEYIRIHHIPNVTIRNPSSIFFPVSPCCSCCLDFN
ncbi:unnamed protein product [Rotaria sordida]|uniref:UDENN domain-containing protein n=1 Tax=Rotaria sordida TaxID=392033 RepID=A0A818NZV9_9BILA|nr:unnamed protein product [Rotaria sordida]CAF3612892.1 unnamed protein product [Rotaria sordida]